MGGSASRTLDLVLLAVGAHSIALGVALLVSPGSILALAHWPDTVPAFFPAQSGLFLVILGSLYLVGRWHRPFAWTVVGSKGAAVVFLFGSLALELAPAIVALQAMADGVMGALVLVLLLREAAAGDHG